MSRFSGYKSVPQAISGGWTVQKAIKVKGGFVAYPTLTRAAADSDQERPAATGRNAAAIVAAINAVEEDMAAGNGADGEGYVEPAFDTLTEATDAGWVIFDHDGRKVAYLQKAYADADPQRERPEAEGEDEASLLASINYVESLMP